MAAATGLTSCGSESTIPGNANTGSPTSGATTTGDSSSTGQATTSAGGTSGIGQATGTGTMTGATGGMSTGTGGATGSGGAGGGGPGSCPPAAHLSQKVAVRPEAAAHDSVNRFFDSTDPFIKNTVLANIEKYRKSDATVKVITADGKPAVGYKVTALLANPDFKWGASPPRSAVGAESATPPELEKLWGEMFNYSIPQYTTKWSNIERVPGTYDYTPADTLLGMMTRNGVLMEQHFVVGYHPDWLVTLASDADRAKAQEAFGLDVLNKYHDKIQYWQVFNEDYKTHIPLAHVYVDQTAFFKKVSTMYPNLKLGVNDCYEFAEAGGLPPPATVKAMWPGIHFLGVHSHKPRRLWASPQQIYQTYNSYIDSGVFLHITEFGIIREENGDASFQGTAKTGTWTDVTLADYFVQTMATCFSHPAVEAYNHFGVGPDVNRYTGNNLFLEGGAFSLSYHAIRSLLIDKFRTLAEGMTDASGQLKYRGLQGEYEATVVTPTGTTAKGRFYLKPGPGQEFTLRVTDGDQQLCLPQ
ncbi:MAG TPA: endo-1,4-beta-xylanase [Polyangiaceae bacterium]